jgi:Uma2 family endonuclease
MSTTAYTTAEDLLRLPDNGFRYELVEGELTRMNPAGSRHGAVIVELTARLHQHVRMENLGRVFGAETGFILQRDPDTVRAPDIAFVRRERLEATGLPAGFYPGAPDLAVEVVSPNDTFASVDEKARAWLAAGARLVWNVRPEARVVEAYRPAHIVEILPEDQTLTSEDVIPGFACLVSEIFPK